MSQTVITQPCYGAIHEIVQFSLFMHPDQAQNTLSGIQGQEATAVAVIYVTAPTSSCKTTKYKRNTIAKIQQKTCIIKTVIRLSTVLK